MTISLARGRWQFTLAEAKAAVAGYAFAMRAIGSERAPWWAYRTYDCVPASPGPGFSDLDILVAAGLNGRLDVSAIGALQLATHRAGPLLASAAARGQVFTGLALAELADDPPGGTTGRLLNLAWREMMSTPDIGVALTHKVLHHKYPALFPLLDTQTESVLGHAGKPKRLNAWQVIWADIDENRAELGQLRAWFAQQAAERNGAPVGLLRLHDILLWLHVLGQWDTAAAEGRAFLPIPPAAAGRRKAAASSKPRVPLPARQPEPRSPASPSKYKTATTVTATPAKDLAWAARQGEKDGKAGTACGKYTKFLATHNLPRTQVTLQLWAAYHKAVRKTQTIGKFRQRSLDRGKTSRPPARKQAAKRTPRSALTAAEWDAKFNNSPIMRRLNPPEALNDAWR